jgi:hypothetical protein
MPLHLRTDVRSFADPEKVADLHVLQLLVPLDHRSDQDLRDGAPGVYVDPVARVYDGDRLGGGDEFAPVPGLDCF